MKFTRDDIGKEFITRNGQKAVLSNVATPINIKLEDSAWKAYPYMFEIQRVGEDGKISWYEATISANLSAYYNHECDDDIVGEWVEPSVKFYHDDIVVIKSKSSNVVVRRHFHSETDEGVICYADGASSITSGKLTLWSYAHYTFHKYEIIDKF